MFFKKGNNNMSLFDKIKNVDDILYEDLSIDEWDIKCRMYSLTSMEKINLAEEFSAEDVSLSDKVKVQYKMIAMSLRDDNGDIIIPIEESSILGEKNSAVVERLVVSFNRMNSMGSDEVEPLEKN